ncbi:hypothetical protein HK097_004038 [Rhizophlyctis rosea]|uniref:Late endosomal/lysosomal adaptor and MAPK and MTOR activator 1 n=1 Tax=Rhizophlyctis rosea TaxID=64517 RepID=A0AAD5X9K4_9FUNG|nr:hypothetical protein HK097_004038 [Rhizophlyctis rosea]
MGACSSCFGQKDSDVLEDNNQATERSRLLNGEPWYESTENDTQISSAINQAREQEYLKRLVSRTAENLIDISSTREVDRILPEHVEEREREYSAILARIMPDLLKEAEKYTKNLESKRTSSPESDGSENGESSEEAKEPEDWNARLEKAMGEVKIQPVGDIVVPIAMVGA